MKTILRMHVGLLAWVCALGGQAAIASWQPAQGTWSFLALVTAQAQASSESASAEIATKDATRAVATDDEQVDPRQQVTELLRRARKALEFGDLRNAESLLAQAESLKVRFGILHVGDTPKRLRRDLERAIRSARAETPQPVEPSLKATSSPGTAPPQGAPAAEASVSKGTNVALSDPASTARAYLAKGRRELARGNLTAASHWYRKAAAQKATLDAAEDSPEKLHADIVRAGGAPGEPAPPDTPSPKSGEVSIRPDDESLFGRKLVTTPPAADDVGRALQSPVAAAASGGQGGSDKATQDRQQSDSLLLAARQALAAGDERRAAELVAQAQGLGARYDFHDDTPQRVAALVERHRALAEQSARGAQNDLHRRQQAEFLLEQAEGLLRWCSFDDAQRLAQEATRLGVEFGPFETSPENLLDRIAAERRQPSPTPRPGQAERIPASFDAAGDAAADRAARRALHVAPRRNAQEARAEREVSPARFEFPSDADGTPFDPPAAGGSAPPEPRPLPEPSESAAQSDRPPLNTAVELFQRGEAALALGNTGEALLFFRQADGLRGQLDARMQQRLADHLRQLAERSSAPMPPGGTAPATSPQSTAQATRHAPPERTTEQIAPAEALPEVPRPEADSPGDPSATKPLAEAKPIASSPAMSSPEPLTGPPANALIEQTADEQRMLARRVQADVARQETAARNLLEREPKRALEMLEASRAMVESSGLEAESKEILLRRVDRALAETNRYIDEHGALIDLAERNKATNDRVERTRKLKVEVDGKIAMLVDECNRLMDEQRYAEAEVVAKRAAELAPENAVVQQLQWQSRFVRRFNNQSAIRDEKEQGVVDAFVSVDQASVPYDDRKPIDFGDATRWEDLTNRRKRFRPNEGVRRSEKELEIETKLKTPVSLNFKDAPLAEVMAYLAKVAGVNLHLDPQGLAEEGVSTDTAVTIELTDEISLKSALNLILEPLHLSYVIRDEVLKITSEQLRDSKTYTKMYNVADLVIPIPNFMPTSDLGMSGQIRNAYGIAAGFGQGMNGTRDGHHPGQQAAPNIAVVGDGQPVNAVVGPNVLPNIGSMGGPTASVVGANQATGYGPGGLGGGAAADFDSLIELITSTISPDSWDDVGGTGSIAPFETNLSLVISQTQEVHEEIVELLDQLRRLQDLQVTIEVRFITLNDNFFERIGVDFDFALDDDIDEPFQVFGIPDPTGATFPDGNPQRDLQDRDHGPRIAVGLQQTGAFTQDLDIPFSQGHMSLAVPQFGGFDPAAGISTGFAILSDLEAFFLINAAQGDRRSNVLQAPKVTLFNGQQAFVADVSQSPFVISVIPVVGEFAAAQQPVIVVLNEGSFLSVQAVVHSDRRFVRLTVVPFFSQIGEVNTFTFTGSSTTTNDTSSSGPDDATTDRSNNTRTTMEGTTVQLPTFAIVNVTTTVSVPDGGTVLLGGIKRLSEGRNEFGVPILNKIPYVNRLFKNVGIGRETQSLMMMVTPRIIIQEEEEEALLGARPTP